jgi:outer membrane protein assembly factor BamB
MGRWALGLGVLLAAGCGGKLFYLPGPGFPLPEWTQARGGPEGRARVPGAPEPPLRLLWQQSLGAAPVGGPLVEGGLVLQLSAGPALLAFDRYSGQLLGRRGLAAQGCAAPALLGSMLVLGEAGPKPALRGYERRENQVRWSRGGLACAPLVGRGDTLVAALVSGEVLALSAAAGQVRWQGRLAGPLWAAPALGGDAVYLGDGTGGLVALEMAGGGQRWRRELGGMVRALAVEGEWVYAATAAGAVAACSTATGGLRWRAELGALPTSGMALGSGVLVLGAADRRVCALDQGTGGLRWQFWTQGAVSGAPAVGRGTVYAGSSEGYLYALDEDSGRLAWKYQLDGPSLLPVALGEGLVAVATEERTLYVFGR